MRMGTKIEAKTHFSGSMMNLNNDLCNNMWDPYRDDRTSISEKSQFYDSFIMDAYPGYVKEQLRQTILKQELIFRHQLQELHRLYKRQRDLMNELAVKQHYNFPIPAEASKPSHFISQVPSRLSKDPQFDSTFGSGFIRENNNLFSHPNHMKAKNTSNEFRPLNSKSSVIPKRVIDLELPADMDDDNEGKKHVETVHNLNTERAYSLADLNEPFHMEDTSANPQDLSANSNSRFWYLSKNSQQNMKENEQPSYSFADVKTKLYDQNKAEPQRKRTLFGVELCETNSLEDPRPTKKQNVTNHENTEKQLPPWLTAKPSLCKETSLYCMNLDSLQNHSQQFFKKPETTKGNNVITKILGIPIIDVPENSNNSVNPTRDLRHHIDLNLSFDEQDVPPLTPCISESVFKIAATEIDSSETDPPEIVDTNEELVKVAAEAIMVISLQPPPPPPPPPEPPAATLLQWFADIITLRDTANKDSSIPEGMDYFEYMTLKLEETKDYDCYKSMIMEEKEKEEKDGLLLLRKRTNRKRGRQKKDFQRDVLPGIISLSKRDVTEDLETFEEAFTGIGVSWQSSLSKKKAAGKNGRSRRRSVVSGQSPPPLPPVPSPEQIICREVAVEEKSLSGWGKRTRRLPRQRCHSLALKC